MFETVSFIAASLAISSFSLAQITISDAQTTPQETAGQDLTIDSAGSVIVSASGAAVTLNSDNAFSNAGNISNNDIDNATAVSLEGGTGRSLSLIHI